MQSQQDIYLKSKTILQLAQFGYNFSPLHAQIAQSVEQRTENPCVGGSIPPLGTISY